MNVYPVDSFMIVSADNLDYVHKYARHYSGKPDTSWHGTTIQIVQPRPNSIKDNSANLTTTNSDNRDAIMHTKRLYSARNSPHKNPPFNSPCPKKARRSRTGLELVAINGRTSEVEQPTQIPVRVRECENSPT